jgi:Ca2+-binding EF-hand superfamily protein
MVEPSEIRDIMAHFGFYATDREMRGLIYKLDHDGDGRICLKEFIDEITPKLPGICA